MSIIISVLLLIDGVIYDLIDGVYDIFDFLARLNIFSEDSYNDIVGRIYIVLGVIMLFVLAYTLLRAIINPDDFAKGEKSFPNLAKNVVISIALIVLLPTIFNVAFSMQNALLNTGTITKLILGDTNLEYTEKYQDKDITMTPGKMMAVNTFSAFFYPNPENPVCGISGVQGIRADVEGCKDTIHANGFIWRSSATLREVDTEVKSGRSMTNYSRFSQAVEDDEIHYTAIISTVAGIFLLYVLLNFCFDMALRVVKLMFYQIIAPIPIICRVIPFGTLKDVFNNWVKQVTGTFIEVFIRIGIMNFGVLLIKLALETFNNGYREGILTIGRASYNLSWLQFSLARVLIILGIVMFVRKAPDLLSKMFGIDTGGMKLGLKEKLQESGVYAAGAAVGAAGGMLLKNGASALGKIKSSEQYKTARMSGKGVLGSAWAAKGTVARGIGSTFAGTMSGLVRGGYRGRNAKNRQEMLDSANSAIDTASKNKKIRENYRAKHLSSKTGFVGQMDTIKNVAFGHMKDAKDDALLWIEGGLTKYNDEEKFIKDYTAAVDSIDSDKDTLYSRNANNSRIQQAYMGTLIKKAQDAYAQQVREGYVAGKEYKDAYGKSVSVSSAAEFRSYMSKLYNDTTRLSVHQSKAFDKSAMESYIKAKQDAGYPGVGTVIKDFYGIDHNISDEHDYHSLMSLLQQQMGDIDRGSKKLIANYAAAGDTVALDSMGLQSNATDKDLAEQIRQKAQTVRDIASENTTMVTAINGGISVELRTYSDESDFKDKARARATEIYAEKSKLEREKAERDAARKKN